MASIYISDINPIKLHEGKAPESGYTQKFATGDDTFIQVRSKEAGSSFELNICLLNGRVVRLTEQIKTSVNNYHFHTFNPAFNRLQGLYKLVLTERDSANVVQSTWESAPICILPENAALPLIQYKNTRNNEVRFSDFDYFSLRVEGGFEMKNEQPKMINTVFMNSNLRYVNLHSVRYYTRKFHAGGTFGINWDVFNSIHHAFGCNTVFIDKEGYVQYEGAEWTANDVEHYPLRTWVTELAPTRTRLTRESVVYNDDLIASTGFWRPTDYWYDDTFWRTN